MTPVRIALSIIIRRNRAAKQKGPPGDKSEWGLFAIGWFILTEAMYQDKSYKVSRKTKQSFAEISC